MEAANKGEIEKDCKKRCEIEKAMEARNNLFC